LFALQDEIRSLRAKLKDAELRADEDRRLRGRTEHESSNILQDNTLLNATVDDLERQLARVCICHTLLTFCYCYV